MSHDDRCENDALGLSGCGCRERELEEELTSLRAELAAVRAQVCNAANVSTAAQARETIAHRRRMIAEVAQAVAEGQLAKEKAAHAHAAAMEPEFVCVPREPTDEMVDAGARGIVRGNDYKEDGWWAWRGDARYAYAAMIDAALSAERKGE